MLDFIINPATGDYLIQNGQFVIGESTSQNLFDIMYTNKGEYKEHPEVGCGLKSMLNGPLDIHTVESIIRTNASLDSIKVSGFDVQIQNGQTIITPFATR